MLKLDVKVEEGTHFMSGRPIWKATTEWDGKKYFAEHFFGPIAAGMAVYNKVSADIILAGKDNVTETGGGERYPTLREKPKIRSIPGLNGEPNFEARVKRKVGKISTPGIGNGPSKQDATDKAYRAAGGTVITSRKHNFDT